MNMRNLLLLAALLAPLLMFAQQQPAGQLSKEYLDVDGARLRLGMSKSDVENKITGAINRSSDKLWFIGSGDFASTLQFTSGRLTFASHSWSTNDNTPGEALWNAANSLTKEGYSQCSIFTDTTGDQTVTVQRLWINCGKKHLLVLRNTIGGKSFESVEEHLGSMHRDD
jgi:hypothetical protein